MKKLTETKNAAAVISALVGVLLLLFVFFLLLRNNVQQDRTRYGYIAANEADHIVTTIDCVMARTNTLMALVQDHNGDTSFFMGVAQQIYDSVKEETGVSLKNLAIAPNGVVSDVYPYKGNESLIGFDFLDSNRPGNIDAKMAYDRGQTVLTNPFSLVQGGMGMAGRAPVLLGEGDSRTLWGLVTVTIELDNLVDVLKLDSLAAMGLDYALSYIEDDGESHIMASHGEPGGEAVRRRFSVRNLTWELAVEPAADWGFLGWSTTAVVGSLNLTISVTGLAVALLGLLEALLDRQMDRWTRRFFLTFFCVLTAYVGCSLFCQLMEGRVGDWVAATKLAVFLEYVCSSLLTMLLSVLLLHQSGEGDARHSALLRVSALLWLGYIALLVFAQFSTALYTIDSQSVCRRGIWYPLLLVPPLLIVAVNLEGLWRRRERLSRRQRVALTVYLLIPMVSTLAQMVFYGVNVIVLGTVLSAVFMFTYIKSDQTERYARQEAENQRLRLDIMLSQIQPHFLYNTLGAIQELCNSDPKAAERATAKFARYLRGNMDALKEANAIPFSRELEHTRLYLELEQMRFEEGLQVRYDIACTEFRIPTLTLQAMAENAVRHGVRGSKRAVGTVTVTTREYDDHYEVTVTDDGHGFDPNAPTANDGRSHVGIPNVRERLRRVCGGELRIASAPDRGTTAVIFIPKEGT